MIKKWSTKIFKMVHNGLKMVQTSQKMVRNVLITVQKMVQNGPKVDHQVDLSANGSYIITHIGGFAEA